MGFKIGIDVGGTFTDLAVADPAGKIYFTKTLSTPGNEADGVIRGIAKAGGHFGESLDDFLKHTDLIVHGTTTATNIMLQFNGAKVGLITTKGFRDEIEIRRGIKESMFDVMLEPPYPIVPRRQRLGVTERCDYRGEVITPLDEEEARRVVGQLRALGVDTFAVCFLFSFLNPAHEERVGAIIHEECPGAYVSLSSRVLPRVRDFERVSTTAVNAYVGPGLARYLRQLRERVQSSGYREDLLIMQSNGGVAAAEQCGERGVYALFSGPAAGIAAASFIGDLIGYKDLITVDMGGTSYDVCLIKSGRPTITTDSWVSRYRIAAPMIDIHSIGAGGGSIAWIDQGGALRVGPQSAGANPGPACYGFGGVEPTVTDADLILGYLNPEYFAGGEIKLDRERAAEALMKRIGRPLNMTLEEAAHAIYRVVNNSMSNGIRVVSVQRGYDPRDFALMAFGGAGGVHAAIQATDLGIPTLIIPKAASVLCALGDLIADAKITETRSFISSVDDLDLEEMNRALAELIRAGMEKLPKTSNQNVEIHRYVEMRYCGEVHEVSVPIRGLTARVSRQNVRATVKDFHDLHEQLYAYRDVNNPVEILNLRVDVIGKIPQPQIEEAAFEGEDPSGALKNRRPVYFSQYGKYVDTPVYDGMRIRPGNVFVGPCVIEESFTTIVIQPGQEAMLDRYFNYIVEVGERL